MVCHLIQVTEKYIQNNADNNLPLTTQVSSENNDDTDNDDEW